MFFKSPEHKQRLISSMQELGKIYDGKLDQEYASALYILTADASTWNKAHEYVRDNGIDIEALLKEVDFSGGYSVLIQLAGNLFNGQIHLDALELMRLDSNNFNVALTSLMIRRQSLPISALEIECSQCHKPIESLHTHTENGVKLNYCSYCYRSQFD